MLLAFQTLHPCVLTLSGHRKGVNAIDFSRKGGLLASGGKDGRALIWNITSTLGDDVQAVLDVNTSPATTVSDAENYFTNHPEDKVAVMSVRFHPHRGHLVAVGLEDGRILLWDHVRNIAKEIVDAGNPCAFLELQRGWCGGLLLWLWFLCGPSQLAGHTMTLCKHCAGTSMVVSC
jgi:WD40 repeat protein